MNSTPILAYIFINTTCDIECLNILFIIFIILCNNLLFCCIYCCRCFNALFTRLERFVNYYPKSLSSFAEQSLLDHNK